MVLALTSLNHISIMIFLNKNYIVKVEQNHHYEHRTYRLNFGL